MNFIKRENVQKSKFSIILSSMIFFLIGLFEFVNGLNPIYLEINTNSSNITYAKISKRSMVPPFNIINKKVNNLKEAIITMSKTKKNGHIYRIELVDYNGHRTSITSSYSSEYNSKKALQQKINNAIQNKVEFKYTIKDYNLALFGLFFVLLGLFSFFTKVQITNDKKVNNKPKKIDTSTTTSTTQTEHEKYNEINDLIIK